MNQIIRTWLLVTCAILPGFFTVEGIAQERSAKLKEWAAKVSKEHENLLLKDWNPTPVDRVPATTVTRAKFPIIDVHNHIDASRNPDAVVRAVADMDAVNVRTVVALTCGWDEKLRSNIEALPGRYPGRFLVCTQVDIESIDSPNFATDAVRRLKDAKHFGAVGIKFRKDLGCYLKDKTRRFVAVNDPRMDAVWYTAGEIGLPVLIHVADPIGFFKPWDAANPTYPKLLKSNGMFYFHGPDEEGIERYSHEALLSQFEDILTRFPKTTFVGLHYASMEHDLERLGAMLDKCPNLHVEMGARHWALGIKPHSGRKFAIRYQDRILFGTDMVVAQPSYLKFIRVLETEDDLIERDLSWGDVHGVHLPDDVLEKIYNGNARRLFRLPN